MSGSASWAGVKGGGASREDGQLTAWSLRERAVGIVELATACRLGQASLYAGAALTLSSGRAVAQERRGAFGSKVDRTACGSKLETGSWASELRILVPSCS